MELATAVALDEDVVALIPSNHNNVDTRCWCTCWLAQVIWCIGETQGDAHTIASSALAVAVVTVRLHVHCAGTAITITTNLGYLFPRVIARLHLHFAVEVQPVIASTIISIMVTIGGKIAH